MMENFLNNHLTNKENLLLNSQIPLKTLLTDDDYVLITGQDKNIQKDYIAKISDLKEILKDEVTEAIFQNIQTDDNIRIERIGNTIKISYNDEKVKILINQLNKQIQQLQKNMQ